VITSRISLYWVTNTVDMAHWNVQHRVFAVRYCDGLNHLNASTYRSIVFRSGIAPRRSTLNFRRQKTLDSNYDITVSTANTRCSTFQCAMATETALSELSAGSRLTSWTPSLQSTIHLKKHAFPLLHTVQNIQALFCVIESSGITLPHITLRHPERCYTL